MSGLRMADTFELLLLDDRTTNSVLAVGRRDVDTVIEHIPLNASFMTLLHTGRQLGAALSGVGARPTTASLHSYGEDLYRFLFRNVLSQLYSRVRDQRICLQILCDHPQVNEVPWEFLVPPGNLPMPHLDRSVVRIHPTFGIDRPQRKLNGAIRVLLVVADPVGQTGIGAAEFIRGVRAIFNEHLPEQVHLTVVEGATRAALLHAIGNHRFDVLHFYGHGDVTPAGVGRLVLQGPTSRAVDYIEASFLANVLGGRNVQLAILSACYSAAGNFANPMDVTATALIATGIPAVIANQYAIPYQSVAPFVATVYRALFQHGDVDVAVAEGRVMLAGALGGTTTSAPLEWGIPVLYRLSNARQLFDL
jgi:hypothetical protein